MNVKEIQLLIWKPHQVILTCALATIAVKVTLWGIDTFVAPLIEKAMS